MIPSPNKGRAIDKICHFVAFGDDVDLILLARELVSKQAARTMVLKIEVIRGARSLMVGKPNSMAAFSAFGFDANTDVDGRANGCLQPR